MDADKLNAFCDTNEWDTRQPIESVLKKKAKQNARRKALLSYEREDLQQTNYLLPGEDGPDLDLITRRCTRDLKTGIVIDDDFKFQRTKPKHRIRELPKGPRDIRTIFYYPKETAEKENAPPQAQTQNSHLAKDAIRAKEAECTKQTLHVETDIERVTGVSIP